MYDTFYNPPLFTREEIAAARPAITTLNGYVKADCLRVVRGQDAFVDELVADYHDLYAWHFYKKITGPCRAAGSRAVY